MKLLIHLVAAASLVGAGKSVCAQEAAPPPPAAAGPVFTSRPAGAVPGERLRSLLDRPEVQSHLKLSVRQKAELGLNPRPARATAGGEGQAPSAENAPPEERQKQVEGAAVTGPRDQMAKEDTVRENKIKDVLTPEQHARLLQLDLQRRGPLALGDPSVAEQIKLDPARRAPVAALAGEAQRKIDAAFSEALVGGDASEEPRRSPAPGAAAPRAERFRRDMRNRLSPLRQKTDKIKKEAEEKILSLLSEEEYARWQAVQGEPFSFRTDR